MADESGQKAMLYFIEVLMNSSVPLSIGQMAGRFGSKNFTPEMRAASGGNEDGLKAFLTKYPSLFHIEGNLVSVNTHGAPLHDSVDEDDTDLPKSTMSAVELELKAVRYFQDKLLKKGPNMNIKSLAGHLSQAPADMRNAVGPQTEFKSFLVKHKDIFIISDDETVSLTEDILNKPKSQAIINRSESDSSIDSTAASKSISKDSKSKPQPITMTSSEYKTMKFVKELIEKCSGKISLMAILSHIPADNENIKNILKNDETKLRDFVCKFPNIFVLHENFVALKKTRLNVIMAGSRPSPANSATDCSISPPSKLESQSESMSSSLASNMTDSMEKVSFSSCNSSSVNSGPQSYRTLNNHKGPVYHLAKLWGIIDLGRHEHVFFDRSILPDGYDDLVRHFKIGQILRFNAVRAARGSRARWRATHIWRDGEDIRSMYGTNSTFSLTGFNSTGLADEVNKLLPNANSNTNSNLPSDSYAYVDASQSNTGCIPVWTLNTHLDGDGSDEKGIPTLTMVPESKYMQKSVNNDKKKLIPGYMLVPTGDSQSRKVSMNGTSQLTREVACQTISTGDIMATQLYQEEE
ncbi:uncharacterized protein [Watersipora subatra]|uniref:uncharacterized protein n=1 Tax=Watersipora subatra TaxID=2589382 RepID=UPI00355C569D